MSEHRLDDVELSAELKGEIEKLVQSHLEHKNIGISEETRQEMARIRLEEATKYFKGTCVPEPPGFFEALLEHMNSASPELSKYVLQFVTFDIWQRPILDNKTRALVCIAGHTCIGAARQVGVLTKIALNNGATPEEIMEVLVMMLVECGFPLAWNGMLAAQQAIKEWQEGKVAID